MKNTNKTKTVSKKVMITESQAKRLIENLKSEAETMNKK